MVVSPEGREGSVHINQDALIHAGLFDGGEHAEYRFSPGRLGYVHLVRGGVMVNDKPLAAGDALLLDDEPMITLTQGRGAEVLVLDLPPMTRQ